MLKVTLKVGEPVAAWSRVALEHVEDSRTTWLKVPLGSFRHFQMTSVESISIVWKALPKAPASGTYPWSRAPHCVYSLWPYPLVFNWRFPRRASKAPKLPCWEEGGGTQRGARCRSQTPSRSSSHSPALEGAVCPVQKAACGRACQRPWELLKVRLEGRVRLGVHGTGQRRSLCAQAVNGSQEIQTTSKG